MACFFENLRVRIAETSPFRLPSRPKVRKALREMQALGSFLEPPQTLHLG